MSKIEGGLILKCSPFSKNVPLHFAHFTTLHSLDGCLSVCNNSIDLFMCLCVCVCVYLVEDLKATPGLSKARPAAASFKIQDWNLEGRLTKKHSPGVCFKEQEKQNSLNAKKDGENESEKLREMKARAGVSGWNSSGISKTVGHSVLCNCCRGGCLFL